MTWRYGTRDPSRDLGNAKHEKVAEHWLKQSGKCTHGRRMFYEGDQLYSFGRHYVAAMRTEMRHDGKPVVLVNCTPYPISTRRGCMKDSPSTGQHREHARSAASAAGYVAIDSLHPSRMSPVEDVADFVREALCELGLGTQGVARPWIESKRAPSKNWNRLWSASSYLAKAKQSAKLIMKRDDYLAARRSIAEAFLLVRMGRNGIRSRNIKSATPFALSYAFAILGSPATRCVSCKDGRPVFETIEGERFAMKKPWKGEREYRYPGTTDLWVAERGE